LTSLFPRGHNHDVFRPAARVASGLVIAPFLLFGSAFAPIHEHQLDGGHSPALVHSHFEPHHLDSAHASEGPEVEQGAERVIWLDSPVIHQTAYHLNLGPSLVAAIFDETPPDSSWSPTTFDDVAPVHGPPRRHSSLRGPPPSLA
jgi:hypothetical protein